MSSISEVCGYRELVLSRHAFAESMIDKGDFVAMPGIYRIWERRPATTGGIGNSTVYQSLWFSELCEDWKGSLRSQLLF